MITLIFKNYYKLKKILLKLGIFKNNKFNNTSANLIIKQIYLKDLIIIIDLWFYYWKLI